MKKNYIYLIALIVVTVVLTLFLSALYKGEVVVKTSYSYEKMNRITAEEYDEYMIEHQDTIIYIADKLNLENNKFEKKLINKLEKLNLLKNTIYIEKEDISESLKKNLKKDYSYDYDESKLPTIIVVNDGVLSQISFVDENSNVNDIVDYEVFE